MPAPDRPPRRFSPAFFVSVVALVVATASGAVAARPLITGQDVKNESLTGQDVKNHTLSVKDLNGGGTAVWALVRGDGVLLRGNGVKKVYRGSAGQYVVVFNRDVHNSGVAVSILNEGSGNGQANWHPCSLTPGAGLCIQDTGNKGAIYVNTEDSAGTNADRWWSIVVSPGGADYTPTTVPKAATGAVRGHDGAR